MIPEGNPEIQEALAPMTKMEESLEVKTEARSEADPASPATKFEELPVAKAEARSEPGEILQEAASGVRAEARSEPGETLQEAAPGVKAEEELCPSAPGRSWGNPAADSQPTPAAGSVKGEPDARAESPATPKEFRCPHSIQDV